MTHRMAALWPGGCGNYNVEPNYTIMCTLLGWNLHAIYGTMTHGIAALCTHLQKAAFGEFTRSKPLATVGIIHFTYCTTHGRKTSLLHKYPSWEML